MDRIIGKWRDWIEMILPIYNFAKVYSNEFNDGLNFVPNSAEAIGMSSGLLKVWIVSKSIWQPNLVDLEYDPGKLNVLLFYRLIIFCGWKSWGNLVQGPKTKTTFTFQVHGWKGWLWVTASKDFSQRVARRSESNIKRGNQFSPNSHLGLEKPPTVYCSGGELKCIG